MAERRTMQRTRTLRGGKILFNDKRSVIDCTVRNLSDVGACLQVTSQVGVPKTFDLMIEGSHETHPCHLIWHHDNRIGVSFDAAPSERPAEHEGAPTRTELTALRAALDKVEFGIVLLDSELKAQFINRAFRDMSRLPDDMADSKPTFVALIYHGRENRADDIHDEELEAYMAERIAMVKAGDGKPLDLPLANGDVMRFQCAALPTGWRMLTYTRMRDFVRRS
jgi:hypothetical protein